MQISKKIYDQPKIRDSVSLTISELEINDPFEFGFINRN